MVEPIADPEPADLPDVQRSTGQHPEVAIDEVGVSNIRYPVVVPTPAGGDQHTVANISMTVGLDAHLKGTHMSRFMRILNQCHNEEDHAGACEPWDAPTMPKRVLPKMLSALEATRAQIRTVFPYFLVRHAPVTSLPGLNAYDCWIAAAMVRADLQAPVEYHLEAGVDVPVATLCPCSREISEYGAHNQRGHVRLTLGYNHAFTPADWLDYEDGSGIEAMWFEDMISIVEDAASCALYPVLKRPDEKHVTEEAYDSPRFVEDVVRNIAEALKPGYQSGEFDSAHIRSINKESIHQHDAIARVQIGHASHLIHDWI